MISSTKSTKDFFPLPGVSSSLLTVNRKARVSNKARNAQRRREEEQYNYNYNRNYVRPNILNVGNR